MTLQLLIGTAAALWLVSIVACVLAWRFSFAAKHFAAAITLSLAALVIGYLGLTHVHLAGSKTVNGVTKWSFDSRWFFITTLVLGALTLAYTFWNIGEPFRLIDMENPQHFDIVHFLISAGIFATFVAFGFCLWFLRREMKKKKSPQKNPKK